MKKRKLANKLSALLLSAVVVSSFAMPVCASSTTEVTSSKTEIESSLIVDKEGNNKGGNSLLPNDKLSKVEIRKGTINVSLSDGKSGTSKKDVEFSCLKVADIKAGEYVLDSTYSKLGLNLNNLKNASDLESAATKLAESAGNGKGSVNKTDTSGSLSFTDLSVGVYLIRATDSSNYDDVTPLLVSIPTWDETKGDMLYEVNVVPKHTPKPVKPEGNTPNKENGSTGNRVTPQTNLNSPILFYFGGAAGLLAVLIIVNKVWKKKKV